MGANVCFLVGRNDRACPLSWSAGKIKRVVRSTLSAEMLSLQEGIDNALYLREMIREMIGLDEKSLPIVAYVDNKSVIQALNSTKMVDDRRLRIDVASIKESMENNEISDIRWIRGENQIANCMTKRGASPYSLLNIVVNGKIVF